jgi:hypothetical protein
MQTLSAVELPAGELIQGMRAVKETDTKALAALEARRRQRRGHTRADVHTRPQYRMRQTDSPPLAGGNVHPSCVNPSAMIPGHYRIRVSQ